MRCRWAIAGVVLFGSVTAASMASPGVADPGSRTATYVGGLTAPRDRVQLRVSFEGTTPLRGRFRAFSVAVTCDDGEIRRATFRPLPIRFNGRSFEGETYRSGGPGELERYMRVEGHLSRHGSKVSGFFYAYADPDDALHPESECGTFVLMSWSALQTRK